jgi:hypothetical protein
MTLIGVITIRHLEVLPTDTRRTHIDFAKLYEAGAAFPATSLATATMADDLESLWPSWPHYSSRTGAADAHKVLLCKIRLPESWLLIVKCGCHLRAAQPHIDFDWVIKLASPLNFDQTQ